MIRHLVISVSMLFLATCGARLPREVTQNHPTGASLPVDMTKVNFVELTTGEPINVAAYMEAHNLQYMLLTFGSQSCGACMEKAHYLETNLVGHYELLGPGADQFEIHGVNTDPERSRPLVARNMQTQKLTHINWADGLNEKSVMMKFFQPQGMDFSVPLTVMIDRKSIRWRIASNESVSPGEIVNRIAKTLGADAVPTILPKPTPTTPPIAWSALAEEKPGRLKSLPVTSCNGKTVATAQDVLEDASLKFVVVDRENCAAGSVCDQNRAVIQDFLGTCQSKSCKLAAMGMGVKAGEGACAKDVLIGGKEVFDTFADIFTWNYPVRYKDDVGYVLPGITGPLVLAFDSDGKIVFTKEGLIAKSELDTRWSLDQFSNRNKGPAFEFYTKENTKNFADWRQQAKYSVVGAWDSMCSGCIREIDEWHKPNGLLAFCRSHPDFCQVLALNADFPFDNDPVSVPSFFNSEVVPFATGKNWDVNLGMELVPIFDGDTPNYRWFRSGWVTAKVSDIVNRVVLYDREGKALRIFLPPVPGEPENPDEEAFHVLQKLFNQEQ